MRKRQFEKLIIWTMITLTAISEPAILVQSARADEPFVRLSVDTAGILANVKTEVEGFKTSLGALAISQNPDVRRHAYEVAALLHDLMPNDYGVMEATSALNTTQILAVTPEQWTSSAESIVQTNAVGYDEVCVYDFSQTSQPVNGQVYGSLQSNALSFDYKSPNKYQGLFGSENAIAALALMNPQIALNGGIFGGLFGGRGGNSAGGGSCDTCGPRNYQCGGGGNQYEQHYAQGCGGGNCYSSSGSGSQQGNRGRWFNPNYRGGGQTTLGATCCDRPYYDIGLGGGRNSRFRDVKGIGLRQSFQKYVGPRFGEGRLLNFFVNPTCDQRARRRLMIVIGTSIATAGIGGAAAAGMGGGGGGAMLPILFLQNEPLVNPLKRYWDENLEIKSWMDNHRNLTLAA